MVGKAGSSWKEGLPGVRGKTAIVPCPALVTGPQIGLKCACLGRKSSKTPVLQRRGGPRSLLVEARQHAQQARQLANLGIFLAAGRNIAGQALLADLAVASAGLFACLLYTSPSPRDS